MGGEHVDSVKMTVYYKDGSHRGRRWRASNGGRRRLATPRTKSGQEGGRGQVAVEEDSKLVEVDGG